MFRKIVNLFNKIVEVFLKNDQVAKRRGVNFGEDAMFGKNNQFGSEPYLINIGDNFYASNDIRFITHDGAVNVLRNLSKEDNDLDFIQPIKIGNNVFLGQGVVLLPGSQIGNNVIVGACSMVKGTLESDSVYAGIPAKKICTIKEYKEKNSKNFIQTKRLTKKEKKARLIRLYRNQING